MTLSSEYIKAEAQRLGFFACGISPALPMDPEHVARRQQWLDEGMHGEMSYLERNEDKRRDPRLLVEGVQCIVSVALNYYTFVPEENYQLNNQSLENTEHNGLPTENKPQSTAGNTTPNTTHTPTQRTLDTENTNHPSIPSSSTTNLRREKQKERYIPLARYARGKDYHDEMKARLFQLLGNIRQHLIDNGHTAAAEQLEGSRVFTDTAPVDERYWAWRSGLGWIGKNSQLIIPGAGSYFFLGELFLTLPADAFDSPVENRCGTCTKCLRACPAQCLSERGLDARKCLSYLTIEYRGEELPEGTGEKMGEMFYGCDRCGDVCPWNRLARPTNIEAFQPSPALLAMTWEDWRHLTLEQYRTLFKGSAVKRAKYEGLTRNIKAISPTPSPSDVSTTSTAPQSQTED